MSVRAKVVVSEKREINSGNGKVSHDVKMHPVMDNEGENSFYKGSTPSGELRLYITNNSAADKLQTGKEYYVDFTEANK